MKLKKLQPGVCRSVLRDLVWGCLTKKKPYSPSDWMIFFRSPAFGASLELVRKCTVYPKLLLVAPLLVILVGELYKEKAFKSYALYGLFPFPSLPSKLEAVQ